MSTDDQPLLQVRGLTKHFPVRDGVFLRTVGQVHAVDDVSFDLDVGETLGPRRRVGLRQEHGRQDACSGSTNRRPALYFSKGKTW